MNCYNLGKEVANRVITTHFIDPANISVLPLFRTGEIERGKELTSRLYRNTFNALMIAGDRFVRDHPECAREGGDVIHRASEALLTLKYSLLFKVEDARTRMLGNDPTALQGLGLHGIAFASGPESGVFILGFLNLLKMPKISFASGPVAIAALAGFTAVELGFVAYQIHDRSADVQTPLELPYYW